ncbi:MAG: FAD-dependent oxidoreductase [Thermaerobacter sp.]|nr:FAD-dependent oxidoreductase [Thermaerobacter sp.]
MQAVRSRFGELRPALRNLGEAAVEAERCLSCGDAYAPAPCAVACPAGIDVPGFIRALSEGDPGRAADVIFRDNPVGGSCARVCPTPVLCEGACVLEHEGERAVSIARLQRFATDYRLLGPGASREEQPEGPRLGRVAVIGAGPGGLACAGELNALGFDVTVFEARPAPGGLVRYAIAPYRQWQEPLDEEADRLRRRGVTLRFETPVDGPQALRRLEAEYDFLYLGVGLGEDEALDLPGRDLSGVDLALPWIEQLKAGRAAAVGERVAVIGGGNTAIDVAREALRLGARDVTVIYRRTMSEMPAYAFEVEEAQAEGVRFLWLTLPTGFIGAHRLQGVACQYVRLSEPDAAGHRRPEALPGTDFVFPCDTAISAIGQAPRRILAEWIPGLEFQGGRLVVDKETGRTGNPRYYAGGDAVNGGATAVQAVSDGTRAARAIGRRAQAKGVAK